MRGGEEEMIWFDNAADDLWGFNIINFRFGEVLL